MIRTGGERRAAEAEAATVAAAAEESRAPITVLFVIKHMNIGGGEYVFRTIIDRLDRAAFRPVLVCLTEEGIYGRQLRRSGVPVHADLLTHKADATVLLRLHRIIRQEHADLLYLMDYRDVMLWGPLAGRLSGIKTILATHSTEWWGPAASLTLVGKRLLPWHERIVAIAQFQQAHLVANEGVDEEKIAVIPNGLDCSRYGPADDAAAYRKRLGLPEDAGFVIGTVAVLRREKNVGLLFAAVRRLLDTGCEARVVIVGDGDQRPVLEESAAAMGLRSRVTFLGFRENPAEILPAFDVFTLTSHFEVMPVTILEAMASELPVVATAVGSVPEIVIDGETGYVIAPGDVDALADRLASLAAASPEQRRRMGRRGGERVRARFSIDAMIEGTETLLRQVWLSGRQP
jgi:glycosyltransferase involved in cell wall biosynthesis